MQNKKGKYHLTIPQENIWLLEKINPNTTLNNILGVFKINKKMDLNILNNVMNKIVETNEALRLRIVEEENVPKQYVANYEKEQFDTYFFNEDNDITINKMIKKISTQNFHIMNDKLYDIKILQNNVKTCVCVKTHHIISDAWTLGQVAEQIKENYIKLSNNEEVIVKPSYIEYIEKDEIYRLSDRYEKDKIFWDNYVKELNCKNKFEVVKNKKAKRIEKAINNDVHLRISEFCTKHKISEYTFFLAIISIYYSKIFGEEEIIIGTPFLNRRKSDKELEMMGMFISTLPIKVVTNEEMTFIEICKNINTINLQCFKHCRYPYYEIQKAYQNFTKENINLYEIAFSYQINKLEVELDGDTGTTTWVSNSTQANPLLISYVDHFGEHILYYDFLINCIEECEIEKAHERIIEIIEQVLNKNNITIQEITSLSKNDIKQIIEFNNSGEVNEKDNHTIISKFKQIVEKNENKVAIVCGEDCITYKELDYKSDILCSKIQEHKVQETAVPIILDNDINFIISILSVMKSGNYYIPILPEESKDRMNYIIKDSKSQLIISNQKYVDKLDENNIMKIIVDNYKAKHSLLKTISSVPSDIAYIIYTSGTTGKPKGVMMKNENIISLVKSINLDEDLKYLNNDVAISLLKHSFDASAIDIYTSLLNGGKLVLVPKEDELNPSKVVDIMKNENVTRVFTVHKWIEQIQNISIENNIKLDKLRIIGTGAEVLKPKKFERLLLDNPNLSIYNTYGPTEATMFMTKHKVSSEDISKDFSPIGQLMPTTRAIVVDKNNNVLPINIHGELAIYEDGKSATNIAKGYLNQEELTNKKFVNLNIPMLNKSIKCYKTGDIVKINNKLELEFIGRQDDFIKVAGGYLVSLNEVEQRIKDLLGNSIEASVISAQIKNVNTIILFVSKNGQSIYVKDDEIKEKIDDNMTFYMKPKHIIILDEIPRNKNGKIDKKKLEEIARTYLKKKNTIAKPQTPLEQLLYDKVKKIVKEDFSITDDFEDDLGLDSLNMTNLYIELNNSKMSIQDLYNYSTVRDLANMMNTELNNKDNCMIKESNLKIKNNSLKFNLKNILLTGVTGFVGVNLLKELVENNETNKIYCIVRSKLNLSSSERFEKTISEYFDKKTCEKIKQKAIILNGDLTQENLGISLDEFSVLTKEISTIINCAANVKHIGKYASFYKDNVKTVQNLIDICKKYKMSLAHISTLSLHGFQNENSNRIFDENILNINQTFDKNPYLISKYEAEQKILRAINDNEINAKIFRIGNIMPRMSDGTFQKNFEQNAFMLAIKEIGNIGLQTIEMLNVDLYLTPVDECSKAINTILRSSEKNIIYHIESDKNIKVADIARIIRNKYSELNLTDNEKIKEKLYENYNVGVEHLNSIINKNTNKYSKEMTLDILKNLKFEWNEITTLYLKNVVDIAFKI